MIKTLRSVLIGFILFVYLSFDLVSPVLAGVSSVDSYCETRPADCVVLAKDLGLGPVQGGVLANTASSATRTVGVEVLDAAGNVVSTTSATVSNVVGARSVMGRVADGFTIGSFAVQGIQALQNAAAKAYKAAHPTDPYFVNAVSSATMTGEIYVSYCNNSYPNYVDVVGTNYPNDTYTIKLVPNNSDCASSSNAKTVQVVNSSGVVVGTLPGVWKSVSVTFQGGTPPWENWDTAKKQAAMDLLGPTQYKDAIKDVETTSIVPSRPPGAKSIRVDASAAPGIVILKPDGTKVTCTAICVVAYDELPTGNTTSEIDSDGDGQPDSVDTDDDNDGIPDVDDLDDDGDGTPDDEETPVVVPIAPKVYSCSTNILECASQKFSTKFPFDIVGTLPSPSSACPIFTFFGHSFELCMIRDFFAAMKYPVTISLLIRSLLLT